MTPEGKVKEQVKRVFKDYGFWFFMPVAGPFGRSGVPDFIACKDGRFVAVEAKAGKGKTTALQDATIGEIVGHGGVVWVVNEKNIGEFRQWAATF